MRRRFAIAAGVYAACSLSLFIASRWLAHTSTDQAGLVQSLYTGSPATLQDRRVVRDISLRLADQARASGLRSFRVRWEGLWYFPGDTIIDLVAWADDRVRVSIDGGTVVHDLSRSERPTRRRVAVSQGFRHLVVRYEQREGDVGLDLRWAPASQPLRPLPFDRLFTPTSLDYGERVVAFRRLAGAFWLGVPLGVLLAFTLWHAARALVRLAVPPESSGDEVLSPRATAILAASALAIAALVRLWGIDFGLPHTRSRPDEEALIGMALRFVQGYPDPDFYIYGPLYAYGLSGLYFVYYVWGLMAGVFDLPVDVAASWHRHWEPLFLLSRVQSAALGTAGVLVIYRLALRLSDRETALVAAFLLALAYLHARDSHFGTVDATLTLLILISIHFLIRARLKPGGHDEVWAGAVAGLAMATKYNAVLLAVPFAVDLTLRAIAARRAVTPALMGRYLVRVAVPAALVFLAVAPYTILEFGRFADTVHFIREGLRTGGGFTDLGYGWTHHLRWTLPYGLGLPLLVASLVGLTLCVRRDWRLTAILCAFPAAHYLVTGSYRWVFARYMLPLVPFLCLLAAVGVARTARRAARTGWPRALATAGLTLVVVWPSASRLFQFDRLLARRDSRVVAAEWVHDHVPAGSTVLQNGGRYGRAQFDAVYGYEELTTERAVAALSGRDGDSPQGQTDWIILYESPLGRYVDPAIAALVTERYELVEFVKGSGSESPVNEFDLQDAFYVPYAGFHDVVRPGPDIRIYRRRSS